MVLGEKVTLGQSIIVTIFSMGVVFAVLLGISYILDGFRLVFHERNKKEVVVDKEPVKQPVKEEITTDDSDDEELIAVITAAIAASLSKPSYNIRIRNIRRIPQDSSPWARIGRQELMN